VFCWLIFGSSPSGRQVDGSTESNRCSRTDCQCSTSTNEVSCGCMGTRTRTECFSLSPHQILSRTPSRCRAHILHPPAYVSVRIFVYLRIHYSDVLFLGADPGVAAGVDGVPDVSFVPTTASADAATLPSSPSVILRCRTIRVGSEANSTPLSLRSPGPSSDASSLNAYVPAPRQPSSNLSKTVYSPVSVSRGPRTILPCVLLTSKPVPQRGC
jgi:hypothetical protein